MTIWRANTDTRFCVLFALLSTSLQTDLLLFYSTMNGTQLTS
ncbi:L* protein [Saffold virus 5]|uniref:L* protein n=1 Tax=Saffold virus 5 TaxID=2779853 RepID=C3U5A4_9PICO|nr:L* protein [Saffold virus 5]